MDSKSICYILFSYVPTPTDKDRSGRSPDEPIYCRYFSNLGIEIGIPFEAVVIPDFVVHCERRDQAEFISLSNLNILVTEPKHLFAVCVAPIFGKEPKWLALAELIEHYRLQGATYFYVYVKDIDDYSNILLKDYARTDDAEIIYLHDNFSRHDVLWQKVELQECIVRARGHSHWVAFIDIDETILMTRFEGTIADYLRQVSDPGIGGLKFRQQWVLRNESLPKRYVNDKQLAEWMQTRRYHNTSRVAHAGYASKCILDPQKVCLHIHSEVNVIICLLLRQYRNVNSGTWRQTMLPALERMGNFSMTDYPEKLQQQLTFNVQRRVASVYSNESLEQLKNR
ncbi:unnamed protein product [Heligmosomoides polygyrus]|uniref:Glycosyltransferase family 92 protein n=1 Tax=Heligmosomoides polygyrus TaxID=6339 RepID=A0A3P7YR41_HELPZ|nr:unnamed protein product [Heligmosomoides polygyrus]